MNERIYSAAIWYKKLEIERKLHNPTNIDEGIVVCGHRHADIITTVFNLTGLRTCTNGEDCTGESVQGFVTDSNRFVNRVTAKVIAEKAGQIINPTKFNELYSEDIY